MFVTNKTALSTGTRYSCNLHPIEVVWAILKGIVRKPNLIPSIRSSAVSYTHLSRVSTPESLVILHPEGKTKNFVYKEVL